MKAVNERSAGESTTIAFEWPRRLAGRFCDASSLLIAARAFLAPVAKACRAPVPGIFSAFSGPP